MRKLIFILIIFPLSLSAQKASQYSGPEAVVYSVPMTSVKITIGVEKEVLKAGPYADFSDMFLSIPAPTKRESTTYKIQEVRIEPSVEADYENSYALPAASIKNNGDVFKLTNLGVLIANDNRSDIGASILNDYKDFQLYSDRLPTSPMESKRLTTYDKVKTDKGFMEVPFSQNIINEKNPEAKAEEAARFLFSLRQRRFELVTGDIEGAFNGSSMKDAIAEIARLESEYLSLFLGKTFVGYKEYTFYIIPQQSRNKSTYNVFRFSPTKGIINDIDVREGQLITLDVTPEGRVGSGIKDVNTAVPGKSSLLYYRVPDLATIQLIKEGEELCSGRMPIYQFGKILSIPSEAVFNTK